MLLSMFEWGGPLAWVYFATTIFLVAYELPDLNRAK